MACSYQKAAGPWGTLSCSFFFFRSRRRSPISLRVCRVSELSDDEDSRNGSESEDDQSWQVTFPELDADIRRILIKYDGAVFPKLNWSSPQVSSPLRL
jgi:hypothetical protein